MILRKLRIFFMIVQQSWVCQFFSFLFALFLYFGSLRHNFIFESTCHKHTDYNFTTNSSILLKWIGLDVSGCVWVVDFNILVFVFDRYNCLSIANSIVIFSMKDDFNRYFVWISLLWLTVKRYMAIGLLKKLLWARACTFFLHIFQTIEEIDS